jgi:hypothetical protein
MVLLKQHQIGAALLEGYYMPPIKTVVEADDVHTSDFLVIHPHGPDREDIEKKTKVADMTITPIELNRKPMYHNVRSTQK